VKLGETRLDALRRSAQSEPSADKAWKKVSQHSGEYHVQIQHSVAFMIVRPHICLRCQIRLAKGISSRSQVVFQSTAAKLQVASDPATKEYTAEREGEIEPSQVRDSFAHQSKLPRRSVLSQYPLGKLYGHSGQKKRENRERLGIDALGEPTNVIVLRDTKLSTYTSKEYIDGEEPESIDILAALDNERGLVGQKEVEENINQFRPEDGKQPRNWDDFNKIVQELQKGFTVSQLARYIQSFEVENKGKSPSKANAGFLIPRISPWMPETSRSIERLDDDSVRGYSAASYTSKQRLVLRLIRECWKLELPELEEGIGEVELELKPRDYDLLLSESSTIGFGAAANVPYRGSKICAGLDRSGAYRWGKRKDRRFPVKAYYSYYDHAA
jgi:hypothetical protein